jgi:hypothetical protein
MAIDSIPLRGKVSSKITIIFHQTPVANYSHLEIYLSTSLHIGILHVLEGHV